MRFDSCGEYLTGLVRTVSGRRCTPETQTTPSSAPFHLLVHQRDERAEVTIAQSVVGSLWSAFNVEKVAAFMVTMASVVGAGTDQALRIVGR